MFFLDSKSHLGLIDYVFCSRYVLHSTLDADVLEGKMYYKCCKTWIKRGGINRFKQQLAAVRGNVAPWEANLEFIGEIRLELQQQFDEFEEKAKQKEMYDH